MMCHQNTNRDSFNLSADKCMKELQCQRCRKESFHKSKNIKNVKISFFRANNVGTLNSCICAIFPTFASYGHKKD